MDIIVLGFPLSHILIAIAGGLIRVRHRQAAKRTGAGRYCLCWFSDAVVTMFISVVGALLFAPAALVWFGLDPATFGLLAVLLLALTFDAMVVAVVQMDGRDLIERIIGRK